MPKAFIVLTSLVFLGLELLSSPAFAREGNWQPLANQNLWVAPPATPGDLEDSLTSNLTGTLRKYKPGGRIKNHYVGGNKLQSEVHFTATVKSGIFSKDVKVIVKARPATRFTCSNNTQGLRMEFDMSQSDEILTENATAMRFDMCIVKNPDGSLSVPTQAYMKEGNDYGGTSGKKVKETLNAQTWPFLSAVNKATKEIALRHSINLVDHRSFNKELAALSGPTKNCGDSLN